MKIKKVNDKPTEPGLYYFRDDTLWTRPNAYYLCGINKVRDERLGLYMEPITVPYAEEVPWTKVFPAEGLMQLILNPYPRYNYAPLSEFQEEWWGPIPGPEVLDAQTP